MEAHFLKQAGKERAGFKPSDFSRCLRVGVSVLQGLFFLMGVEKVKCAHAVIFREQKTNLSAVPHEFSTISQIKFNLGGIKVKVF